MNDHEEAIKTIKYSITSINKYKDRFEVEMKDKEQK